MLRLIVISIPLMALWLLMSGIYKPLLISFGVLSCAISVWIMHRMEKVDGEVYKLNLNPFRTITYLVWLFKEIAVSSFNVTKIAILPKAKFNQKLFSVPVTQATDMGQVMYANSITLTPGTITVETEPGYFLIHALDHHEDDYAALEDMDQRVSALEVVNTEKVMEEAK